MRAPAPLRGDKLIRFYNLLRYGRSERTKTVARTKIILGFARFAYRVAKTYAYRDSDNLFGEALLALVQGVTALEDGAIDHHVEPNPAGYLKTVIEGRVRTARNADGLCRQSLKTVIKNGRQAFTETKLVQFASQDWDTKTHVLLEDILSVTKTETERQVVLLRAAGHTDAEIAQKLGFTQEWIRQVRSQIARRFL